MTRETELKPLPCPFCGHDYSFRERLDYSADYQVCNNCMARGPIVDCENAYEEENGDEIMDEKCAEAWNRRA